eukprot:TRINITY_DN27496_c0_g1_i1.p1 TRINITY_DN27496_c0_g1~~TRINITY_DN27496_c0_g1_i1.p1  ORF type:complete len:203 (+),score=12.77 TRINITY_DN27496_c0_g1_i1:61-669(+)
MNNKVVACLLFVVVVVGANPLEKFTNGVVQDGSVYAVEVGGEVRSSWMLNGLLMYVEVGKWENKTVSPVQGDEQLALFNSHCGLRSHRVATSDPRAYGCITLSSKGPTNTMAALYSSLTVRFEYCYITYHPTVPVQWSAGSTAMALLMAMLISAMLASLLSNVLDSCVSEKTQGGGDGCGEEDGRSEVSYENYHESEEEVTV